MSINFTMDELEHIEYVFNNMSPMHSPTTNSIKNKIKTVLTAHREKIALENTQLGSARRLIR